ncbi:MAG: hypothetical protein ABW123_25850 [Cystobacter sp.]
MAFTETVLSQQPEQSFTVFIPYSLQARMEELPSEVRHTLVGELFRLAAQAGQERVCLPRFGAVNLEFQLAGCDVSLELDAPRSRLTLVSLEHGRH